MWDQQGRYAINSIVATPTAASGARPLEVSLHEVKVLKRETFYFFLGCGPEYHSVRKFEFESIWQKNPMRTGHRAGVLKTFLPSPKSGV